MQVTGNDKTRLEAIDLARGLALVAMAIYHFAWDLEFFGYAERGMTAMTGWRLFARSIASSFLFLVGFSLVLAHARGIRWRSFRKRLVMVAAAALAISTATYLAVPSDFIFFGILHQIALASLLGLAFLRLPVWLVILVAIAVIAAPLGLRADIFNHPSLWWVGLSSVPPRSNDYVPLFPWFGAVLLGMAAARIAMASGFLSWLGTLSVPRWTSPVQAAGRHSLAVYLIHQPVLIGGLYVFSLIAPPVELPRDIEFTRACTAGCEQTHDAEFCAAYCSCVLSDLEAENRFDEVFEGRPTPETSTRLQEIVQQCTFGAEFPTLEEGEQ